MSYSARSSDPLQELLANAHNLLPIALALAAWAAATWSKLKKRQATAAPPAVDESERTRRVQEEVRRKIAERRAAIPPIDPFGGPSRRVVKPALAPVPVPPAPRDDSEVLERQRWLAEQASVLDAASRRSAAGVAQAALTTPLPVIVSPWLAELREPASFRRAILLREILGPPVGLR